MFATDLDVGFICGADRTGGFVIEELLKIRKDFVVIENDQNRIKELTSQKTSVLNMMQSAMAPRLGIPVLPRIPQIGQQK